VPKIPIASCRHDNSERGLEGLGEESTGEERTKREKESGREKWST
jgi:hypothetical protein